MARERPAPGSDRSLLGQDGPVAVMLRHVSVRGAASLARVGTERPTALPDPQVK